jgi:hypothetical protein
MDAREPLDLVGLWFATSSEAAQEEVKQVSHGDDLRRFFNHRNWLGRPARQAANSYWSDIS